jgi:anthranilate synthase component 1
MELSELRRLIMEGAEAKEVPGRLTGEITPLFDRDTFCSMVEKARHYIKEGDIFQVVLSNRLSAPYEGSLLNTYRVLRTVNPSPYMFYFSGTDVEVAGASPETLVRLENGVLHTFPLAGTRPRGKSREEDLHLEEELLQDEKELAEHNMLVDLGRNDLGRVSRFGTVEVEKYQEVLRFSHVMHIGSTVRGEINRMERIGRHPTGVECVNGDKCAGICGVGYHPDNSPGNGVAGCTAGTHIVAQF